MDAHEINSILTRHWSSRSTFLGTFPCDKLPTNIGQSVFGLVVNTEDHTQPGGHWLAIYSSSLLEPVEYFDSYGNEPTNKYIKDFIQNTPNRLQQHSGKQVQQVFSASCGLHCVYYLVNRCMGIAYQDILNTYSNTKLSENDNMVNAFCKENFGFKISKTDSRLFLMEQMSREIKKSL